MSHSNRRKQDIWKRTPRNDAPSSKSPSIRPSNSFMEKLLHDCLKPRLITNGNRFKNHPDRMERSHHEIVTKAATSRQTPRDKGSSHYRSRGYGNITDVTKTIPYRKGSSHYKPESYRHIPDSANTPPPCREHEKSRKQSTDFVAVSNGAKHTPRRSGFDHRPRDYRHRVDKAKTRPPRISGDYGLKRYKRIVGSTRTTSPHGGRDYQPRDYGPIRESTVTSRSTIGEVYQPREFSSIFDNAPPLRDERFQHRDDGPILGRAKTKNLRGSVDYQLRDYGPTFDNARTMNPQSDVQYQPGDNMHITAHPETMNTFNSKDIFRYDNDDFFSHQSSPPFSISFQEEREQALRDYKVTIEYKHLKSHAPGGVYLIPSMDSLRDFYGIIFVRRGPFTNGIFKFRLSLPPKYNDTNMWPNITFSSHVYNPYVDEKTGKLDVQSAYQTWDPSRHYLVTVLTYLKKIFYSKNFSDAKANPKARELAEKDPQAYKKKVEACVYESQKKVYVNEKGSTAKFTEEEVAHRVLRDLLKHHIRSDNQVTKQIILAQVEKSRKV